MAVAIVRGSATNPTQAARASGKTSEADVVRLRRQFQARRTSLLADAEKRCRRPAGRTIDRSDYASGGRATSYLEEISRHVSPLLTTFEREMEKLRPINDAITEQISRHSSGLLRIQEEIDLHVNRALDGYDLGMIGNRRETSFETFTRRAQERERRLLGAFAPRNPRDRL